MIHAPEAQPTVRDRLVLNDQAPDRGAVLEQLERLLSSDVFRGSKRVSGLLRYIVEQTLDNGGAELKERMIGVHVFGRSLDYDTSAEPVVRVSAGDLRKRIAQYYHESGREGEIRIDLPTGSYRPVFHLPAAATAVISAAPVELPLRKLHNTFVFAAVVFSAALVIAGVWVMTRSPGNEYTQFWDGVTSGQGTALIYAPAGRGGDNRLVFEDAIALADLSGDLRVRNKPYRILTQTELTPETLKQGPALLIGGYTNPLVRRLTQQLRFTFANEGDLATTGYAFIQDRQNLSKHDWATSPGPISDTPTFTDYAVISRVIDPVTDQIAVTCAGIRKYGTLAAAEFLSHPDQMEAFASQAPKDWRKKNMQAVLAIDVKAGKAGPAKPVASYFW